MHVLSRKTDADQRGLIDSSQAGGRRSDMHIHSLRRRLPVLIPVLWVAAVIAICWSATAIASASSTRPHLAGTWSGRYSGAYKGTFTLRWRQSGSKLNGSIALSYPHGTYPISGSVNGNSIRFGAVGAGATYTGSVSGKSMSGRYRTATGGGTWSAHKTS